MEAFIKSLMRASQEAFNQAHAFSNNLQHSKGCFELGRADALKEVATALADVYGVELTPLTATPEQTQTTPEGA